MMWIILVLVLWSVPANAQLWNGYLNSTRGVDWQGMVYNHPNTSTWTQCGATISPPSSSAAIQAVIDACT